MKNSLESEFFLLITYLHILHEVKFLYSCVHDGDDSPEES